MSYNVYLFKTHPCVYEDVPRDFEGLRKYLANVKSLYGPGGAVPEGLVFHHSDGRMAKLKVKDFDLKTVPLPPSR